MSTCFCRRTPPRIAAGSYENGELKLNRAQPIRMHVRAAFLWVAVSFAGNAWASTGACMNPSGQTVTGCFAVDGTFSGFITPADNQFSSADVGTNYLYNPTVADQGGSGWTFSSTGNTGGSNANGALIYGSQWYADAPPSGSQVAGLQQFSGSTSEASISQEVSGFTVGSDYAVTFDMAERAYLGKNPSAGDTIEVLLGGQILGTFTPTTMTWAPVTTGEMKATSTTMNLEFLSTSIGVLSTSEVDTLLTDVLIDDPTGVPEPATLALVGGGLLLVAAAARRRKRSGVSSAVDGSAT
jgi:PEP-CTERM motif